MIESFGTKGLICTGARAYLSVSSKLREVFVLNKIIIATKKCVKALFS